MRIVFYIIGVIGLIAGALYFSAVIKTPVDLWCRFFGGSAMMAGGVVLIAAGKKNFRGSWPFVIGLALIVFACGGLGTEIDNALAHQSEDLSEGIALIVAFSTFGLLLLLSARKMHRLLLSTQTTAPESPPPGKPRIRWVRILLSFVVVFFCLGLFGYIAGQNYLWKTEVTYYAQSEGRSEAKDLFHKGKLMLYVINGELVGGKFTGKYEGPFEVWTHFYQPSLGAAHRYSTLQYIKGFNDEMRNLQQGTERAKLRHNSDKDLNSPNNTK